MSDMETITDEEREELAGVHKELQAAQENVQHLQDAIKQAAGEVRERLGAYNYVIRRIGKRHDLDLDNGDGIALETGEIKRAEKPVEA